MNMHAQGGARHQAGFGLVEVMIAMTIGLILLGGLGYVFLGSKQMNTAQTDGVRLQESVRNTVDVVGAAVRKAGYRLNYNEKMVNDPVLQTEAIAGTSGAADAPDTLIVRHDPIWSFNAANPYSGEERNCEGVAVTSNGNIDAGTGAATVNTKPLIYQFRLDKAKYQLMCYADSGSTPATAGAVVAEHVADMQISYGISDGAEKIERFTDLPVGAEFAKVASVRLTLLLRGPSKGQAVGGKQTVKWLGADRVLTDGHLYKVVTTTFTIRNQVRS